ncbi:MAG: hypothetical protein GXP08_11790 [Gammaproteobacteria bacterium]|nr:hypothetical protein [Gammaproteobacteria bacterium]
MSQTQVLSYFTGLTITPVVIRIQYDQGSICYSIKEVNRSFVGQKNTQQGEGTLKIIAVINTLSPPQDA